VITNESLFHNDPAGREWKFFDTIFSSNDFITDVSLPTNGAQLCLIPQGVGQSERLGRKICIRRIQMRIWSNDNNAASGGSTGYVSTLYLVLDKQCNGAAAGVLDVFTTTTYETFMLNLDNLDRFVLLKVFPMSADSVGSEFVYPGVVCVSFDVRIPIEYDSSFSTGALTTIRSNNLFLINSKYRSVMQGVVRLLYHDD